MNKKRSVSKKLLLAVNPFILAINIQNHQDDPEIVRITTDALQTLINEMNRHTPFSEIITLMHEKGYECTPDDILMWSQAFLEEGRLPPEARNNDLGYEQLSPDSFYRDPKPTVEPPSNVDIPLPSDNTSIYSETSSSSLSDTAEVVAQWAPGPGIGFTTMMVGTFALITVIEYLKS